MREDVTSSAGGVRLLLVGLAHFGLSAEALCAEAGLDLEGLDDPEARVAHDRVNALWRAAEARTPDPHLGLKVAGLVQPRAVNVASYLLMSSRTVREGVERVVRFQRLITQASRISLDDEGGRIVLHFGLAGGDLPISRHQVEFLGLTYARFLAWITEGAFRPAEVRFRHVRPASRFDYEAAFRAPCRFEQIADAFVVDREAFELPSVHANAEIGALHEAIAHRRLEGLGDSGLVRQVEALLLQRPEEGRASVTKIARQLAMSPRTLQRRLAEEGTTFEKVREGLRRDLAIQRLVHTDDSIGEVAYVTGFSEPSAFIRQFKAWTQMTPAEYRRAHRADRGP